MMAAQHFITDKVIHFIMNIPGNGIESNEENMFKEEGMPSFTQPMSMVVTVTMLRKVLRR